MITQGIKKASETCSDFVFFSRSGVCNICFNLQDAMQHYHVFVHLSLILLCGMDR